MDKKRKNNFSRKQSILFLVILIACMIIGYITGKYVDILPETSLSSGEYVLFVPVILFLELYAALFLQVIVHETGHLIFGLLTGYRFFSFRLGNILWQKENGKIRLRTFSLAGTSGQCLMLPPELHDREKGRIPFALYHLGGAILNIFTGLISFGLYLVYKDVPYLSSFIFMFAASGIFLGVLNGVPLRLGMVDNDGYNTIAFSRDKEALNAYSVMMKIHELNANGIRLKDMPEELFSLPSEESMNNSIIAALGVFSASRLMDLHQFDKAKELIEKLLSMKSGLVDLYRFMLINDLIYCEIIGDRRKEILVKMFDNKQKKFMKLMKNNPSVLRTQYAFQLLMKKDLRQANKIKTQFEKCCLRYPYAGDVASERELIDIADNING